MKYLSVLLFMSSMAQATNWYKLDLNIEGGFSAIASHEYQSGHSGTRFNFVKQGNQSVLLPFWRSAVGLSIYDRHLVEFTYQPIFLDTQAVADNDLKFDNITIPKGQPFNTRYYFPFYRLSYLYRIFDRPSWFWSIGGGIQMRSATISFTQGDGSERFVQNNIGPVPLLQSRFKYQFENHLFVASDLAGWWSPIPVANGSDKQTTGWIYDVALQGGIGLREWLDVYLSARLIGGGADGDGSKRSSGDSYTYNNLNILNFSTGLTFKL